MKRKQTKPGSLEYVNILPTDRKDAACLSLTDTAGIKAEFIIGPEGLKHILQLALGLASHWAGEPDLQVESWSGQKNALPAQHVELARGRTDTECGLRVFVGKVELAFLMPLDTMIHAMSVLSHQIDQKSGKPAH